MGVLAIACILPWFEFSQVIVSGNDYQIPEVVTVKIAAAFVVIMAGVAVGVLWKSSPMASSIITTIVGFVGGAGSLLLIVGIANYNSNRSFLDPTFNLGNGPMFGIVASIACVAIGIAGSIASYRRTS